MAVAPADARLARPARAQRGLVRRHARTAAQRRRRRRRRAQLRAHDSRVPEEDGKGQVSVPRSRRLQRTRRLRSLRELAQEHGGRDLHVAADDPAVLADGRPGGATPRADPAPAFLARVFELVDIAPWSDEEVAEFYEQAFRSAGADLPRGDMRPLVRFTGGFPSWRTRSATRSGARPRVRRSPATRWRRGSFAPPARWAASIWNLGFSRRFEARATGRFWTRSLAVRASSSPGPKSSSACRATTRRRWTTSFGA